MNLEACLMCALNIADKSNLCACSEMAAAAVSKTTLKRTGDKVYTTKGHRSDGTRLHSQSIRKNPQGWQRIELMPTTRSHNELGLVFETQWMSRTADKAYTITSQRTNIERIYILTASVRTGRKAWLGIDLTPTTRPQHVRFLETHTLNVCVPQVFIMGLYEEQAHKSWSNITQQKLTNTANKRKQRKKNFFLDEPTVFAAFVREHITAFVGSRKRLFPRAIFQLSDSKFAERGRWWGWHPND